MCNIAGYAGSRRAAPILIEMLKRQEIYDGGLATGIATVHEGKLYMRKVAGNLEELLRDTDALDLPGNIGIIHTRPGNSPASFTHPHLSEDGQLAVVLNGTIEIDKYYNHRKETTILAEKAGYEYIARAYDSCKSFPELSDGGHTPEGEQIAHLTAMYRKEGNSYTKAFRLAVEGGYTDLVGVMLTANDPDVIRACRITRPMVACVGEGETFIASCEYAFGNDISGTKFSLPALAVCEITKGGVKVTDEKVGIEPVAEPTPRTYALGMELISGFLREQKELGGAYFDKLELFLKARKDELFEGGYTYSQYARLVYELIYQLEREGKLKGEVRLNQKGNRYLRFMWID